MQVVLDLHGIDEFWRHVALGIGLVDARAQEQGENVSIDVLLAAHARHDVQGFGKARAWLVGAICSRAMARASCKLPWRARAGGVRKAFPARANATSAVPLTRYGAWKCYLFNSC